MAIALEDTAPNASGTSGVVLTPSGGAPASGEVIYVALNTILNSSGNFPSSYTLSGFTQKARFSDGIYGELVLFRKVAGASEPTSYTVTSTGGDPYRCVGALLVLSGVDTTTPDGTAVTLSDTTADTAFEVPALTTTAANSWDLAIVGSVGDSDPSASGTNAMFVWSGGSLIERTDFAFDYAAISTATALRASAGTQALTSATTDSWVSPSVGMRIEIFESGAAAAAVATQSHFRWRADDGDEDAATWLAAEDTSIDRAISLNTRLRVQVDTANDLATQQFQLEWKLAADSIYKKLQVSDATAIGFGAIGTVYAGTAPAAPPVAYPTGITAGQQLILVVANRPNTSTVSLPSGWTAGTTFTGGAGAEAAGTGTVRITTFSKIADGTETGTLTLTITSGLSCGAAIFRCTKASASKDWAAVAYATGADNTAGATPSVPFGSDPGVTAGDLVLVAFASSEDTATFASEALTQTGITYGTMTERADTAIAQGNDLRLVISEHAVTSGTSSAAATWTATASGTNAANTAGPAIMIRLRQVDQPFLFAASANIVASGENTTAQLSAPAGKTTADFTAGRIMDDENPADTVDIVTDDYTELEYCLVATAQATNAATYNFRLTKAGTALDTYTVTPSWTIGTGAAAAVVRAGLQDLGRGFGGHVTGRLGGYIQ